MARDVPRPGEGAPLKYNEELLAKAYEFPKQRLAEGKLPTIEGLAMHLGVVKATVYNWEAEYPEFAKVLDYMRCFQADELIQNGLSGKYNAAITAIMLSKHDYIRKTEEDVTSGGKPIGTPDESKAAEYLRFRQGAGGPSSK